LTRAGETRVAFPPPQQGLSLSPDREVFRVRQAVGLLFFGNLPMIRDIAAGDRVAAAAAGVGGDDSMNAN